jgi:hypothetical protein
MPAAPLVDPEVEDVVQEDVGRERADAPLAAVFLLLREQIFLSIYLYDRC